MVLSHGKWTFSRADPTPAVKPASDYLTGVLGEALWWGQQVRLTPSGGTIGTDLKRYRGITSP